MRRSHMEDFTPIVTEDVFDRGPFGLRSFLQGRLEKARSILWILLWEYQLFGCFLF
ncbi:hypothetical protein THIOKS1700032 [Thiocapsa sp. KS1]|nr:hypothetical protein THIOKS1700032 [Thiocapsa sp. KS1]